MSIRNISEINAELIPTTNVLDGEIIAIEDIVTAFFGEKARYTTDWTQWIKSNSLRKDTRSVNLGGPAALVRDGSTNNKILKDFFISSKLKETNSWDGSMSDVDTLSSDSDMILLGDALVLTPRVFEYKGYKTQLNKQEIHYSPYEGDAGSQTLCTNVDGFLLTDNTGILHPNPDTGNAVIDQTAKKQTKDNVAAYLYSHSRTGLYTNLVNNAGVTVVNTNAEDTKRIYTNTTYKKSNIAGDDADALNEIQGRYTPNIWGTADLFKDTAASIAQVFCENEYGIYFAGPSYKANDPTKSYRISNIQSKFYLRKNQPFSFSFDNRQYYKKIPETSFDSAKGSFFDLQETLDDFSIQSMKNVFTEGNLKDNITVIRWGSTDEKNKEHSYALCYYFKSNKFVLFEENAITRDGKTKYLYIKIDTGKTLKSIKPNDVFNIMIYPIGTKLAVILYENSDGIFKVEESNSIIFNVGHSLNIAEAPITLYFYGGSGITFDFKPVYHQAVGQFASNIKDFNYIPNTTQSSCTYIGKKGTGKLQNEVVTFSDETNDKYGYLSPCKIIFKKSNVETWFSDYFKEQDLEKKWIYYFRMYSNKNYITRNDDNEFIEYLNKLERYYSPAIYTAGILTIPNTLDINLIKDGNSKLKFVKNVSINQTVEGYSGSLTLYNKSMNSNQKGGQYTGDYRIKGVKPIKIEAKLKTTDRGLAGVSGFDSEIADQTVGKLNRLFTGYITTPQFNRSSNTADSTVTLTLSDASIKAKETFAFNLPIFDGYCNLAAIYYLGKYAGYSDDELLLYQNPYDENIKIRIVDQLQKGGNLFAGGCFNGHVDGFPRLSLSRPTISDGIVANLVSNLDSSVSGLNSYLSGLFDEISYNNITNNFQNYLSGLLNGFGISSTSTETFIANSESPSINGTSLHACLPLAGFFDAPNYMFQMGTPIWDCMKEIAEFTGFYLYANNWGNIVYSPPELALSPYSDFLFVEMPGDATYSNITNFNEIVALLSVSNPTDEIKNAVMIQGLQENNKNGWSLDPIISIRKQKGWPYNVEDPTYVPWLRWMIQRNPHWNDPARLDWNTTQLFARASRERSFVTLQGWG